MLRVVLVDDEPQSCKSLAIKLKDVAEDIEIAGSFYHPDKAISGIRKIKPDLIFLDIEMPGLNGFQLLEKMEEFDFEVIFVTAYNEYMLNALRISALDYLLKPVKVDELRMALQRFSEKSVLGKDAKARINNFFYNAEKQQLADFRLALATTEGMFFLSPNDIVYCEGQVNYTLFHLSGKKKMLSSKTLKEYDELLSDHQFIRIHKSYLVNRKHIASITHDHKVAMHDGTLVEISKRKFPEVKMILQNN